MTPSARPANPELVALVHAARDGDVLAWGRLVTTFDGMLRAVARSCRLAPHDVDDAVQTTWVKLYENIDGIRDPSAVAGWLATTVRREALRLMQVHVRECLTDAPELAGECRDENPAARLLESERRVALSHALAALPERHRRLMTLIADDTRYQQIGAVLDMPLGSIGPIRRRSLARMQRHPELQRLAG
jgi:RNA polymerase sigma factor (sigma-70 family)